MAKLKDIIKTIPKLPTADLEALQAAIAAELNARNTQDGEIIVIAPPTDAINL